MQIVFDLEAMTVTAGEVEPIEVADVTEAIMVIEAAAGEMTGEEIEQEDEMLDEEAGDVMPGKGKGRMAERAMVDEEEGMMAGYK